MKWSRRLLPVLVTSIVFTFFPSATVSNPRQGMVITTLAIDVGSSATRLSVLFGANGLAYGDTGEPRIILTGPGTHSSPGPLESSWTPEGYLLIEDGTDEARYLHPSNTLFNLDHPITLRSKYAYKDKPHIAGFQAFSLIDITGMYLEMLTTSAERIIGQNITSTAIVLRDGRNVRTAASKITNDKLLGNYTYYHRVYVGGHDLQENERKAMGRTFLYRPTELYTRASAAIFPFDNIMEYSRAVLVYHLGGSTFEVSVHQVDGGTFNIMSSVYEQHLGGNDINRRVVDHLLLVHKNKTGQDLSGDNMFLLRLEIEVERAKKVLSVQDWVQIEIEPPQPGGQGLSELLTRPQFEDLNMDLFNRTIKAIDRAIGDSLLYTKDDIQNIVFSGGSANIPFLQSTIREYFGPHKKYHGSSHPHDTVVLGAAKLGHWYKDIRHTHDVELCHCVPGRLTPTLGIETTGGVMFKYTDRKATTTNKMYTFSTTKDNQDRAVIRVFGGTKKWTNQTLFLGGVELTGIAPAPKGVPHIRVRLSTYGCSSYVNLYVTDVASGRTNATVFSADMWVNEDYGLSDYKVMDKRAFELEPAGKLTLLHSLRYQNKNY